MSASQAQEWVESFSPRELEVLRSISNGMSNRDIAQELYLSIETVKWYNKQIFIKLGVKNRTQAANRAAELNLLDSEDALSSVEKTPLSGNLPAQLTSFVGRGKEISEITDLLKNNRLVVLTGAGGSGKTRLAMKVAEELKDNYRDGVWLVELANIREASLVSHSIANVLNIPERTDAPLDHVLKRFLSQRHLLLLIDNLEHLLECTPLIGELLAAAPQLVVIATSRERLHIYGEQEYPVSPLNLPDSFGDKTHEDVGNIESIALFIKRARAVHPTLAVDNEALEDLARICVRLDGLPLAIELCAPMVKVFSFKAIADRIEKSLDAIPSGPRDLPTRQQTLRDTIRWSYDLLEENEKHLFERLAVFNGGGTLQAVEKICGDEIAGNVGNILSSLVNKNLLLAREREDREIHFEMLETVREYAREKLVEAGETERVRQRHRDFFVAFAEQAEPRLKGAGQVEWLDHLEAEHDNLRTVLQWTHEVGDVKAMSRLAEVLFWFWKRRGHLKEGRVWLERALAAEPGLTRSTRATLLYQAANSARAQGDFKGARKLVEQSIVLWRTLDSEDKQGLPLALALLANSLRDAGDPGTARSLAEEGVMLSREQGNAWNLAWSLISLGMALAEQEEYNLAQSTIEESKKIWQELGDLWGLAEALHYLALVTYMRGDYKVAYSLAEEVLSIQRQVGDKHLIAYAIHILGVTSLAQGNLDQAKIFFEQDLALFREMGDKGGIVFSLQWHGLLAHLQGDNMQAQSFLKEGLSLAREAGPIWISSSYLLRLAYLAADREQFERAVRLCSAAKAHLEAVASSWDAFERSHYERIIDLARASLGEDAFAIAQAEGRAMTLEQAVLYALEEAKSDQYG